MGVCPFMPTNWEQDSSCREKSAALRIATNPIGLWPVGRPKAHAGYVRQCGVVVWRHRWNGINHLGSIGTSQQAVAAVVKLRTLFEVVRPISDVDGGTGCSVGFNGVLIDRRIDHAQIVQNSAGLRTFARPEEPRNCDRGQ